MGLRTNGLLQGKISSSVLLKTSILVVAALIGTGAVTEGASATLDAVAYNATPQTISSGTLKFDTPTAVSGSTGFSATFANMNPGDTRTVGIEYTNSGTSGGFGMALSAGVAASNNLSSDASRGLQVVVSACSVAWSYPAGSCGGTTTVVVATSLSALVAASANGVALTGITTLASAAVLHLQFAVGLPNATNNEVWVNGAAPTGQSIPGYGTATAISGGTITGLSASVTWVLRERQATGATTNS